MAHSHRQLDSRKESSLNPSHGAWPCNTLILDFYLPELQKKKKNQFLLFKTTQFLVTCYAVLSQRQSLSQGSFGPIPFTHTES